MEEKSLRRFGICKGDPAKRRTLALALPKDCTEEVITEMIRQAALEIGVDRAPERVSDWLEGGHWRERWRAHLDVAGKAMTADMPAHRVRGLVVGRVLGDHAPVTRVAAEFGMRTDEVLAIVAAAAEDRGWPKRQLEELLGIAS